MKIVGLTFMPDKVFVYRNGDKFIELKHDAIRISYRGYFLDCKVSKELLQDAKALKMYCKNMLKQIHKKRDQVLTLKASGIFGSPL